MNAHALYVPACFQLEPLLGMGSTQALTFDTFVELFVVCWAKNHLPPLVVYWSVPTLELPAGTHVP